MSTPIHFKSISDLAKIPGFPALQHPLFTIIKIEALEEIPEILYKPLMLNFYTIDLKKNLSDPIRYGRTTYDFKNGILGFTAPNQLIEISNAFNKNTTGWIILFQRAFLKDHSLQSDINQYGFFDYQVNEALHLSDKEEKIINNIFESIAGEYHNNIDAVSRNIILSYLALLLNYSNRFYQRQFITRNQVNDALIERFETQLRKYFQNALYKKHGLPTVTYFADVLHVSPGYLSDYLKAGTGKSTQEHIHEALIEHAKAQLLSSGETVSAIAYDLGFEYSQYFSRLFKQKTGLTPGGFRKNLN